MRYCKSKSYTTELTVISEEVYFEGDIINLDVQLKFCELIVSGYFLDSVYYTILLFFRETFIENTYELYQNIPIGFISTIFKNYHCTRIKFTQILNVVYTQTFLMHHSEISCSLH